MSSSLARYELFLLKNASFISSLESSLRSLTWFLPGRFKDAELASEALTALLNVTSMYHDTLVTKMIQSDSKYKPLIPSSHHTRFTRAWADRSNWYKWTARILELIRFTELLIEMGFRRKFSAKTRWRGIMLIELIKAFLRLVLLKLTRRPLLSPPIPERDLDLTSLPPPSVSSSPTLAPSSPASSPPATPEHLKNNHVPLPVHPLLSSPFPARSDTSVEDYLLPKALTLSSVKPPISLVRPLTGPQDWLSEILYTFRPLIYASLFTYDRRSNSALVASLAMEIMSRYLRRPPPPSATLERAEYARRDRDMLWYLLRGAVWQSYTRPKLEALADRISHTWSLGIFSALVRDWMPLIDEYYYYTAP